MSGTAKRSIGGLNGIGTSSPHTRAGCAFRRRKIRRSSTTSDTISAAAPQVRQAFTAWRQALGLGECREQPGGGGTSRLHAADRSGGVTVRLTATVFEQEEA